MTDFDGRVGHLVRVQTGQLKDGVELWRPLLCCLHLAHDENIAGKSTVVIVITILDPV